MPYFFFEEDDRRTQHSKWELIDQATTFEEARVKQKELRQQEKRSRKVIKAVYAQTPEAALRACATMMGHHEAKRWAKAPYPY